MSFYDGILPIGEPSFQQRLQAVESRITAALARCGRKRSQLSLVAVSKKFSAAKIIEAYQAGCRDFGENYVQEFAGKAPKLANIEDARFHLIGHLQSNKTRLACELFNVIQTVDTPKLVRRIDQSAAESGELMECLIEVKLAPEESKTGCEPEAIPALLEAAKGCKHVRLSGLMVIPPWSEDAEVSRPYFRELARLGHQYGLTALSMGMSNDLEVAIEEGATIIRVGTALFGQRPKPGQASVSLAL